MKPEFCEFTARLLAFMSRTAADAAASRELTAHSNQEFKTLALDLFSLQCHYNGSYRRYCEAQGATPENIQTWGSIPAVPAVAFKELDLSCLSPSDCTKVFLSSGTTQERMSRHHHGPESLRIYEESLLLWFKTCVLRHSSPVIVSLTPPASQAPYSSLVHMFDCLIRKFGSANSLFVGRSDASGDWMVELESVAPALNRALQAANPVYLVSTAFSFVHLLEHMAAKGLTLALPPGSLALETGGYKGRSRSLPKQELHNWICDRFGLPPGAVISEYGMCELSSQAYAFEGEPGQGNDQDAHWCPRFLFPPWARTQIISPETGREVAEGQTGLLRIFDLANVFSVLSIQTEDLAVRRGESFELIGRAASAEPRGCSLMATG